MTIDFPIPPFARALFDNHKFICTWREIAWEQFESTSAISFVSENEEGKKNIYRAYNKENFIAYRSHLHLHLSLDLFFLAPNNNRWCNKSTQSVLFTIYKTLSPGIFQCSEKKMISVYFTSPESPLKSCSSTLPMVECW